MLLLKKGSLVREFVSKINVPNISSNPLGFKRNFCGQACSLNPKTSIYKLLDSFIVQIGSVIKSLRRCFLVCFAKIWGVRTEFWQPWVVVIYSPKPMGRLSSHRRASLHNGLPRRRHFARNSNQLGDDDDYFAGGGGIVNRVWPRKQWWIYLTSLSRLPSSQKP